MRLRTFLDLGYLVRHQSVSLTVNGLSRLLVGSFGKAEDLAGLLVEPVAMVLNLILVLYLHVLSVGFGYRFCSKPFDGPVVVHE